jgi:hypothetical protein
MSKNIFIILFTFSVLSVAALAVVMSPGSGVRAPAEVETLDIHAEFPVISVTPQPSLCGAQIRMDFTNATVLGITPPAGYSTPTSTFTDTYVNIETAKLSGAITAGESLGQVVVRWGSAGAATVVRRSDMGYADCVQAVVYFYPGTAGSYTISDTVPRTDLDSGSILLIGLSVILIAGGYNLYNYLNLKGKKIT